MSKQKIDGFVMTLTAGRTLLGKTVQIRWIDRWGEAFYRGVVINARLYDVGADTPSSVEMWLENPDGGDATLIVPVGNATEVWLLNEPEPEPEPEPGEGGEGAD